MNRQFVIFSVLFGFTVTIINSKIFTVQVDEVKLLNSTYLEGYYNISRLTVTKLNRSTFVLNTEFDLLSDTNDDYFMSGAYYLKRRAGMHWSKSLYFWPKQSICLGFITFYKYAEKGYNNTNIPHFDATSEKCLLSKVSNYSFGCVK